LSASDAIKALEKIVGSNKSALNTFKTDMPEWLILKLNLADPPASVPR
jgi:hypothetical protein